MREVLDSGAALRIAAFCGSDNIRLRLEMRGNQYDEKQVFYRTIIFKRGKMAPFDRISKLASSRQLPFLLIGGHAVAAHGYGRTTVDVDLLIRKHDRQSWLDELSGLGYRLYHDGVSFLQLSAAEKGNWPLDLMLVDEATFEGMWAEAISTVLDDIQLKIPSLRHLLALKLHALKSMPPHRLLKDLQDVASLIKANGLDARDESFRELVLKYGDNNVYDKILEFC